MLRTRLGIESLEDRLTPASIINTFGTDTLSVGPNEVRVQPANGAARVYQPFETSYTGSVQAISADLDGDGQDELIVSAGDGGSGRIVVARWTGTQFTPLASFFGIEDSNFRGGANITATDVDGDGRPDLIVGAGLGGGPRVSVYTGTSLLTNSPTKISDFFAFAPDGFRGGVSVATGDFNNDGAPDLVIAAGPGGGPRVRILTQTAVAAGDPDLGIVNDFFAGNDATPRDGVSDLRVSGSTISRLSGSVGERLWIFQNPVQTVEG